MVIDIRSQLASPPGEGHIQLGRTLPSLLDEACDLYPNDLALNEKRGGHWHSLSTAKFRAACDELALGLLDLGLHQGDRVALFMESNRDFAIADVACACAGLVSVPIDLSEAPSAIAHILRHADAKVLIVSKWSLFSKLEIPLRGIQALKVIAVADSNPPQDPEFHYPLTEIPYLALAELRLRGRKQFSVGKRRWLRSRIRPHDLATIIYVIGGAEHRSETTGLQVNFADDIHDELYSRPGSFEPHTPVGATCDVPRGVALTHENISATILAAFSSHPDLNRGQPEVALSFLPLTHIFARAFLYGHLNYGHTVYFSSPERVSRHLQEVQPTIFITVPRLLEKAYERILQAGSRLTGWQGWLFRRSLQLANRYEVGTIPRGWYGVQLAIADRWLFPHWRKAFGSQLKYLICGGAALSADIANVFSAAGIPVLQGYGLTETSSVVCYNRGPWNRAGTVGLPIPGAEVAIAADGEILVRSAYVMQGYYRDDAATAQAIDEDGWFHTGDLGEVTDAGFLRIAGYKKNLFKLSTGKYVSPQPLERYLVQSPMVERAIAVGAQRKFCSMLIFPQLERLQRWAQDRGIGGDTGLDTRQLLEHPQVVQLYQSLVDEANECLPYWSRAKRFQLLDPALALEESTGMLERSVADQVPIDSKQGVAAGDPYAAVIEALYDGSARRPSLCLLVPLMQMGHVFQQVASWMQVRV